MQIGETLYLQRFVPVLPSDRVSTLMGLFAIPGGLSSCVEERGFVRPTIR